MKLRVVALSLMLFCFLIESAQAFPWDTPSTHRWYMRADTHTVNDYLGYVLNRTLTSTTKSFSSSDSGDFQVWWSVRVWVVRSTNASVELTDGTYNLNVTRTVNGAGLQNATWTPPLTNLYIGADALRLHLYIKIGGGDYQHKATFITAHLETKQIVNSTWTFRLYTNRTLSAGTTYGYFLWGNSGYETRIEKVELAQLSPWETMSYHLRNSDYISFLFTPWTYYIGNVFWGIMLLFLSVTTYNRYSRIEPIIVMFWIFGGTGSILTFLVPAVGLNLSWFLLAFALGATLYKLLR